ncbi:MAG: hypothetical protein NTW19_00165, partial [Planctomycetota bacterium]|nr:hypothetical protein [Planctomycetota bacterium]
MSRWMHGLAMALSMLLAGTSWAGVVTLDLNGFPNAVGAVVNGPGLAAAIKIAPGQAKAALEGLQAGQAYYVDFLHNSGDDSSDFLFTMNAKGDGVESVSLGGGKHTMVAGFKPGDATLVMNARDIVFNANGGQTGPYYIQGLFALGSLPPNAGPQKLRAIPGLYAVDALYGSGGKSEDFTFIVGSEGTVSAGPTTCIDESGKAVPGSGAPEHATYAGNAVTIRAALVHFRIVAPKPPAFNVYSAITPPRVDGSITEFDLIMNIGSTGILIWSFGPNTVTRSDLVTGYGKPFVWAKSDNDLWFAPRLRYDVKKGQYFFETTKGPANTVMAEASGTEDDKATPLVGVEVTATIVKGDVTPAATQP